MGVRWYSRLVPSVLVDWKRGRGGGVEFDGSHIFIHGSIMFMYVCLFVCRGKLVHQRPRVLVKNTPTKPTLIYRHVINPQRPLEPLTCWEKRTSLIKKQ